MRTIFKLTSFSLISTVIFALWLTEDGSSGSTPTKSITCPKPADVIKSDIDNLYLLTEQGIEISVANSNFISAIYKGNKKVVGVKQDAGGVVRAVRQSKTGEIFAIGDQKSFRMNIAIDQNDHPIIYNVKDIPLAYEPSLKFWERAFRSPRFNSVSFSQELSGLFVISNSIFGNQSLKLVGYKPDDILIGNSSTMYFVGDIGDTQRVLLRSEQVLYAHDGKNLIPCKSKL